MHRVRVRASAASEPATTLAEVMAAHLCPSLVSLQSHKAEYSQRRGNDTYNKLYAVHPGATYGSQAATRGNSTPGRWAHHTRLTLQFAYTLTKTILEKLSGNALPSLRGLFPSPSPSSRLADACNLAKRSTRGLRSILSSVQSLSLC